MKLIVTADLHLNDWPHYNEPWSNGLSARLHDQISLLNYITEMGQYHHVDGFLILGDIFEHKEKVSGIVINEAAKAFNAMRQVAQVFFLVGNHDFITRDGTRHLLENFIYMEGIDIFPFHGDYIINDVKFSCMGYQETDTFQVPVDGDILVGHLGLQKCALHRNYKAKEGIDPMVLKPERFKACWIGHQHITQRLDPNILCLGAPIHFDWRDCNKKEYGFWLMEIDNTITETLIQPTFLPEFRRFRLEYFLNPPDTLQEHIEGNIVRIVYLPEQESTFQKVKGIIEKLSPVAVEPEIILGDTNTHIQSKSTDRDEYGLLSRYVSKHTHDPEESNWLLKKGMGYFKENQK